MVHAIEFRVYLITDEETALRPDLVDAALSQLPRGEVAVQLRAPRFGARELMDAAARLLEITRAHEAPLLINDRLDVALAVAAEGVHLPQRGLPPRVVRSRFPNLLVGASTHTLSEARRAEDSGADFLCFGPVHATPSKKNMGVPVGVAALADAVTERGIPVFALGGVDLTNSADCLAVGARLACVRAILGAPSPAAAARSFTALLSPDPSSNLRKPTPSE